jgi:hypothetical protein
VKYAKLLQRFITVMAALLVSSTYALAVDSIDAKKAQEIGCRALQEKYPREDRQCADLGVYKGADGWEIYDKCPPDRFLCGSGRAVISPQTGEIIDISYSAT